MYTNTNTYIYLCIYEHLYTNCSQIVPGCVVTTTPPPPPPCFILVFDPETALGELHIYVYIYIYAYIDICYFLRI
jgi:hypothetical protein